VKLGQSGNSVGSLDLSHPPREIHYRISFRKRILSGNDTAVKCRTWLGVHVTFLHRCEAVNMTILGDNGRNRIAAPTDGHEWREVPTSWTNRLNPPSDASTWHTIYTHEGHRSSWVGTAILLRPLACILLRMLCKQDGANILRTPEPRGVRRMFAHKPLPVSRTRFSGSVRFQAINCSGSVPSYIRRKKRKSGLCHVMDRLSPNPWPLS